MVKARVPTIDVDFQHDRRDEVFEYIRDRFGSEHVAQIITNGEIRLRSGIDHLCKIYKEVDEEGNITKYGPEMAEVLKKTIPNKFPDQTDVTYAKMKLLAEEPDRFAEDFRDDLPRFHNLAKEFMKSMDDHPVIHEALKFFEGLVDNYGRHAAAVVITTEPITDHVPIYKAKKEAILPVTAFNMKEIDDDLHMLKLDALSLKTLTVIQQAVQHINNWKKPGEKPFNIRKIPMDDQDVYRMIREGNTTGVFQLVGNAITQYTKKVRPQTFGELMDILALD